MRKALLLLILFVLSPISPAEEKAPADTRLLQPVTMESTGKRLHSVVDEIAKMTGVTIRCGDNSKDWQVRDIPVTVCTHELPLGVLLQSLADCTHLRLSGERGVKDVSYRIWRDQKRQKELDDYAKAMDAWHLAMAAWDWDVAAKLKDIPITAFQPSKNKDEAEMAFSPRARALSQILSALGPGTRDRVLAGEELVFDPNTASEPLRSMISAYVEAALQGQYQEDQQRVADIPGYRGQVKPPTEDMLQGSFIRIRFNRGMIVSIGGKGYGSRLLSGSAIQGNVKGYTLPSPPKHPNVPGIEREGTISINDVRWAQDPRSKGKVNLKRPEGKEFLTTSDLVAALCRTSSLFVVCEDYCSHVSAVSTNDWFGRDADAQSILRFIAWQTAYWDGEHGLLVASENMWPERHLNLVPESLLNRLIAKLGGDGVSLDDSVDLAYLTLDQCWEWLVNSEDIRRLQPSGTLITAQGAAPALRWYGSLSPQQKEQILSESGLPLSRLDLQAFCDSLGERTVGQILKASPEERSGWVVRIVKEPYAQYYGRTYTYNYRLAIEDTGAQPHPKFKGGCMLANSLPIYSNKRQEELRKQLKDIPDPSSPSQ